MVPQVIDNKIYLTGGYHHYGKMLQWNDIYKEPELVWTDSIKANELGGSILYEDMLIVSGNSKGVFCLDSKTGKTLSFINSMNSCNFMVADGMLYCYESKGHLVRLLNCQMAMIWKQSEHLGQVPEKARQLPIYRLRMDYYWSDVALY